MEHNLQIIVLFLFVFKTFGQLENNCITKQSILGGEHLICLNVSASYFQYSGLKLNKSHWVTCVGCNLNVIKENTFNFPKNNVSYLNFTQNNVLSIEPYSFSRFHLLKYLNLKENLIEYLDTKVFVGLRRLLHLDLSKNRFKIVRSNTFAELESLDILNLNSNNISYLHNDAFVGLINLKYLYLNRNKIKNLLADSFKHLNNLKILYLEENKIKDIHPIAFNNLKNLNLLYLNDNAISYLVQYNFKQLTSLVDLQLRNNNLTEIQTSSFNGLTNLKFLYLGRNHLKTIQPYGLIGLNSLLILDLIGNDFDEFNLDHFKNMYSLTTIWLEKNQIKNLTIEKNNDFMLSMKTLDIIDNQLKNFDYKLILKKMPNLQEVLIGGNQFDCEFFVEMKEFFQNRNVSVCLNGKCNQLETENFVKKTCHNVILTSKKEKKVESDQENFINFENEHVIEDISLDFSTDSSNFVKINLTLMIISIFASKCLF
ncbi:leucine-rich repeat-containing protein 70-like [Onthophagus taurus]|uniref:leucine-rich repeat-containing protein 70-like n=1 Tax=Onthophagus taurus TaxID=166361 RepID=UPI0039BE1A63